MVVNAKKVLRAHARGQLLAQRKAPFLKPPAERPRDIVIVPNLVRGLVPSAPDQIWVADITYVHLARDLRLSRGHPRRLLAQGGGLGLGEHARCLTRDRGIRQAIEARKPQRGSLIHHSDRGVQYASIDYRQILADHDIAVSMSRPGNPFDNAKAESFMKTLKTEEVNGKAFSDIRDARRRIDSFIADVYNKERLHSALGYRSPLEFEAAFAQNKAR